MTQMLMFYLTGWGSDHALETENTLRRVGFSLLNLNACGTWNWACSVGISTE